MARRVAGLLGVIGLAIAGCVGSPALAPNGGATTANGVKATFTLDTRSSSFYRRGVLYVTPTKSVKVTVEAPGLDKPFSVVKTLDSLDNGVSLTVDNVPKGDLRVVTLQWLDDAGQELPGVYYRAQGTLDETHQRLVFNNLSTAEGDVLLQVMKNHPDAAAILKSEDIHVWMNGVLATAQVPNARFLDIAAVSEAMVGLSTKHMPTPKPEWGLKPGYVSIGFKDVQNGLRIRAAVSDPASGFAETTSGDTLVLGPIPAKADPYKLMVAAMPTGGEGISADLDVPPVDVVVKAGQTTVATPISFVHTKPGTAMPDRVGRGSVVDVTGTEDNLWILNGVKFPDGDPTGLTLDAKSAFTDPMAASGKAYRYADSRGWDKPLALDNTFPLYGSAAAAFGTKIFCFGGIVNQARSGFVGVIETAGTPALTGDKIALPTADGETNLRLTYAVAGAIGNKIYVTGGIGHDAQPPGDDGSIPDDGLAATLVFDPVAKTFGPALAGPNAPYKSMAGAVVGTKWYLFGGYRVDRNPAGDVQIFDSGSNSWSSGKPMPTPRYGCATAVVDGKVWVIGGETLRGAPSRAVEVYDPATDTWTRHAPLRTPCSYAGAAVYKAGSGSKIVVAGGVEGVSPQGFPMPLDKTLVEEITP